MREAGIGSKGSTQAGAEDDAGRTGKELQCEDPSTISSPVPRTAPFQPCPTHACFSGRSSHLVLPFHRSDARSSPCFLYPCTVHWRTHPPLNLLSTGSEWSGVGTRPTRRRWRRRWRGRWRAWRVLRPVRCPWRDAGGSGNVGRRTGWSESRGRGWWRRETKLRGRGRVGTARTGGACVAHRTHGAIR